MPAPAAASGTAAALLNGGLDMDNDMMIFLDCPAYLDAHGDARCGLPAEVEDRYSVRSSDGPLDSARIRCPRGHWFNGPLESLIWVRPVGQASLAREDITVHSEPMEWWTGRAG